MSMNFIPQKDETALRNRVKRYLDNGAPGRAMAADCSISYSVFEHIVEGTSNKGITALTARRLTDWMDHHMEYAPQVKKCSKCGHLKPLDQFYRDRTKKSGHRSLCADCQREIQKEYQKRKKEAAMEATITKELVEKVKAEDKREVESKYMAPYFNVAASQLDAIRAGKYDKLLLTPKPKAETDAVTAINKLREELNRVEQKMDSILLALGVKEVGKNNDQD